MLCRDVDLKQRKACQAPEHALLEHRSREIRTQQPLGRVLIRFFHIHFPPPFTLECQRAHFSHRTPMLPIPLCLHATSVELQPLLWKPHPSLWWSRQNVKHASQIERTSGVSNAWQPSMRQNHKKPTMASCYTTPPPPLPNDS